MLSDDEQCMEIDEPTTQQLEDLAAEWNAMAQAALDARDEKRAAAYFACAAVMHRRAGQTSGDEQHAEGVDLGWRQAHLWLQAYAAQHPRSTLWDALAAMPWGGES
jgi:hypothetical protein